MPKTFLDRRFCGWCGGKLNKKSSNQLVCSDCHVSEYNNPRTAAAALIFNESGELLVTTRRLSPGAGKLDTPGGFVDNDEHPVGAIIREVKEEAGLDLVADDLTLAGVASHSYRFQDRLISTCPVFYAVHLSYTPSVQPGKEISKLQWIAPKHLDFNEFFWPEKTEVIKAYLQAKNML